MSDETEKPPPLDWTKVRALSAALAKDSSALTAALVEFEKRVVGLDLGIVVSVPMDSESHLRFCKQKQNWGLFVVKMHGGGDEELGPLSSASRKYRILAAHQTVALLARLVEEGERALEEVRVAGESVTEAIDIASEIERGD